MAETISERFSKLFRSNKNKHNYLLHITLFIITFITTVIAGLQWTSGKAGPYEFSSLADGLPYSFSILFIPIFLAISLILFISLLKTFIKISFFSFGYNFFNNIFSSSVHFIFISLLLYKQQVFPRSSLCE